MLNSQFAQLLMPTAVVAVWQSFLSFMVLMGGSTHTIIAAIAGDEEIVNDESLISSVTDRILEYIDQFDAVADIVLFMFWAAFGSALYALLWALSSLIIELYKDVSFGFSFIHPQEFNRSQHWTATASTTLARIASAIMLISFFGYWFAQLVPGLSDTVSRSMNDLGTASAIRIFSAVAFCALSLHFMTILTRIFLLRTRIMGEK